MSDLKIQRRQPKVSPVPAVITLVLTFMFAMYGVSLLFSFPDVNRDMYNAFGADLRAAWLASIFYWMGNTRGSQNKDQLLADSAPSKRSTDND